jgi:hypothetical protein
MKIPMKLRRKPTMNPGKSIRTLFTFEPFPRPVVNLGYEALFSSIVSVEIFLRVGIERSFKEMGALSMTLWCNHARASTISGTLVEAFKGIPR